MDIGVRPMVALLSMLLNMLVGTHCKSFTLLYQKLGLMPSLPKMAKLCIQCQFSNQDKGQHQVYQLLANNKQGALDQLQVNHLVTKGSNQIKKLNMELLQNKNQKKKLPKFLTLLIGKWELGSSQIKMKIWEFRSLMEKATIFSKTSKRDNNMQVILRQG